MTSTTACVTLFYLSPDDIVEIAVNGAVSTEIGPIVLEHGGKWKEAEGFCFAPAGVVNNRRAEFL